MLYTMPYFILFSAVTQNYQTDPNIEYVIIGNDALVKCSIPSFVADFGSVVGWVDSEGNEYHKAAAGIGMSCPNCLFTS